MISVEKSIYQRPPDKRLLKPEYLLADFQTGRSSSYISKDANTGPASNPADLEQNDSLNTASSRQQFPRLRDRGSDIYEVASGGSENVPKTIATAPAAAPPTTAPVYKKTQTADVPTLHRRERPHVHPVKDDYAKRRSYHDRKGVQQESVSSCESGEVQESSLSSSEKSEAAARRESSRKRRSRRGGDRRRRRKSSEASSEESSSYSSSPRESRGSSVSSEASSRGYSRRRKYKPSTRSRDRRHARRYPRRDSYDTDGYDRQGYDPNGYDREGYDRRGFDRQGFDPEGYDKRGFDRQGYDRDGYDPKGYDRFGHHIHGLKHGRHRHRAPSQVPPPDVHRSEARHRGRTSSSASREDLRSVSPHYPPVERQTRPVHRPPPTVNHQAPLSMGRVPSIVQSAALPMSRPPENADRELEAMLALRKEKEAAFEQKRLDAQEIDPKVLAQRAMMPKPFKVPKPSSKGRKR